MMSSSIFARANETVEALRLRLPAALARPRVAIVCGSGLGGLAETIDHNVKEEWEYKDVPNFPLSSGMLINWQQLNGHVLIFNTVPGHEGKLIFSTMGPKKVPVVLLVGRAQYVQFHSQCIIVLSILGSFVFCSSFYEGLEMDTVTFATRVCKVLGVQTMILTNAAGGLNPDYAVGDIVCLNDHVNLAGLVGFHPLRGPNDTDFGVRFPPLSDAYDISLRMLAHRAWQDLRSQAPSERRMHEGVYAYVAGPSYETRAECRLLRTLGADVVGMSTVPEIIVARHSGMKVLAFSLVTNNGVLEPIVRGDDPALQGKSSAELDAYLNKGRASHEEVLEAGRLAAKDMQGLVLRIASEL